MGWFCDFLTDITYLPLKLISMDSKEKKLITDFRKKAYFIEEDGQHGGLPSIMAESLNNAADLLAGQLYSKDLHFLFELIQNAEDNEYIVETPELTFRLLADDPTNTLDSEGCLL